MEQLVVPKAREIDEEELAWPLTESYDEDTNDDAENEESVEIDKCPALKQLDDPAILRHSRDDRRTSLARKIGEEVLAWQALQDCQCLPNRSSHDVYEKTLAKRFDDVLRRRYCAIGDRPCQQKLSADVLHFISGIPGVPHCDCSVNTEAKTMQTDQRQLENLRNYKESLRTCLSCTDYAGAAALKKQFSKMRGRRL